MFNLAFISHFYAVGIRIIQTFQPKDEMLSNSRCNVITLAARSLSLKFYEKLHYLLDSWMFTTLPAAN